MIVMHNVPLSWPMRRTGADSGSGFGKFSKRVARMQLNSSRELEETNTDGKLRMQRTHLPLVATSCEVQRRSPPSAAVLPVFRLLLMNRSLTTPATFYTLPLQAIRSWDADAIFPALTVNGRGGATIRADERLRIATETATQCTATATASNMRNRPTLPYLRLRLLPTQALEPPAASKPSPAS